MSFHTKNDSGFTLIELSIVLVIIGLIIGGVLVGQDLITAATVRAQMSQVDRYRVAATTFYLKYRCLPGDCSEAESFGLGTSGGPGANGDGDEQVFAWPWVNFNYADVRIKEYLNFYYHLQQASMVEGAYSGYTNEQLISSGDRYFPKLKAGPGWVFAFTTQYLHPTLPDDDIYFGNIFYLATLENPSPDPSYNMFIPIIPVSMAYMMDQKMDDGLPLSGAVRAGSGYSGPMICNAGSGCDPGLMSYRESGFCSSGLAYNVANPAAKCILAISHAF